jgi:CheY-like chemotaxis protein
MDPRVLLYVEDDDAALMLFETALKTADIEVQLYRVSDGEQAIKFLHGGSDGTPRPDLVVLDLNLPRKNGLDVLDEIKRDRALESIRVVVFTSSSLSADRRRSIALGAQGYITKPFTYDGFVEAVKMACAYLPA